MAHTSFPATELWSHIKREAITQQKREPLLSNFLRASISVHQTFGECLCAVLSGKLKGPFLEIDELTKLITEIYSKDRTLVRRALLDLGAILERDPAVHTATQALLYSKGYHALQAYRLSHHLWNKRRKSLAYYLQGRVAEVMSVDIHPAAEIGHRVMVDHATGVVIGETTVIGNNVSLLHGVTLGGTGKEGRDRHPKIGDGVLLGTGCRVLGNIKIGKGAKVAAGSVVLEDVLPRTTVAGVPAKSVGQTKGTPARTMNQRLTE